MILLILVVRQLDNLRPLWPPLEISSGERSSAMWYKRFPIFIGLFCILIGVGEFVSCGRNWVSDFTDSASYDHETTLVAWIAGAEVIELSWDEYDSADEATYSHSRAEIRDTHCKKVSIWGYCSFDQESKDPWSLIYWIEVLIYAGVLGEGAVLVLIVLVIGLTPFELYYSWPVQRWLALRRKAKDKPNADAIYDHLKDQRYWAELKHLGAEISSNSAAMSAVQEELGRRMRARDAALEQCTAEQRNAVSVEHYARWINPLQHKLEKLQVRGLALDGKMADAQKEFARQDMLLTQIWPLLLKHEDPATDAVVRSLLGNEVGELLREFYGFPKLGTKPTDAATAAPAEAVKS